MPEANSLLSQIHKLVTVDVDSMDSAVAARHALSTEAFSDMTSNQAILYNEAIRPENSALIKHAIQYVQAKALNQSPDAFIQDVIDVLTVLLAKRVYPNITGKLHAQTSPSTAYDSEKTIEHAKKLVALFEEHDIPKNRVCIKIPATPESMIACHYLTKIGIQTLATCLFSVPQAVAASQAGCIYVAPYFNELQELRVHFEPQLWIEYKNPVVEHPMSQVIQSIIQLFKEINSKTLVMPASIVNAKEAIALASLRPDHITISSAVLDELASSPAVAPEIMDQAASCFVPSVKGIGYLDNSAVLLKEALMGDHTASKKLVDALSIFEEYEKKTKDFIKQFEL
ncbi:aldolase [Crucibulum laeve]|uniref:Aldolase n=1 Tax=Crucibulum laeve TaxID=68775 RepID=A0A5C3MAC9_9AGAR|nr:aldolase [Crucibulum laeve]